MAAERAVTRPVKITDCDHIVNIDSEGKLYDGLDYIPQWIRPLTQDKATNSFVCEIDGKIVSYCNMYAVEDGTKMIVMSGRTVKHLRGQGVNRSIYGLMNQTVSNKYPKLKSLLYIRVQNDPPCDLEDFTIKENFFSQHSTVDALRRNLNSPPINQMGRSSIMLSPEEGVALLTNNTIRMQYFNQPYINAYSFWWPINPTKQTMRLLALRHNVAASFGNISALPPKLPQEVTAVSFSDITRGVSKFCLDVFFHGTDVNLLKDHVLTHLRKAVSVVNKGDFGLKLHFPLAMNDHKNVIDSFLKVVFLSPNTWGRRIYIVGTDTPFPPKSHL